MCEMCTDDVVDFEAEMSANVTQRVALGFALLIEHGPALGFDLGRVDLDTLDVSSGHNCIVAQASGESYGHALEALEEAGVFADGSWSSDYGFSGPYYGDLTEEWRRVIAEHRTQQEV